MKMKRRPVTNLRITKDKNVQGCQPHWGDQELVAGVYHKSFSYSRARGDDLTTFSSVDDSPLYDSPFDDSPIDNCPIEDSTFDDCSAIVHQCDQIFLPLDDSSLEESLLDDSPLADSLLCSRLPWRSRASTRAPRTGTPWSTLCPTRQMLSLRSDSQVLYSPSPLSSQFSTTHLFLKVSWGDKPLERATFYVECLL